MKIRLRSHWLLIAGIAVFLALVLAHFMFKERPKVLSMDQALSIAQKRIDINEARRNPDRKRETVTLVFHRFDDYDGTWGFDFKAVGCEYSIAVEADGSTDMTGIRGCEMSERSSEEAQRIPTPIR